MDKLMLLDALTGGSTGPSFIEASEKRGQQQLVASAVMPTDRKGDAEEYAALGFVFGEIVEGDEIFIHCALPEGWTKQASDHDMWSYILDDLGRRRVAVFYKAAFYDRSAFCRIETAYSYLSSALYEKREPILDDVWLTPKRAAVELDQIAQRCDESAKSARTYAGRNDGQRDYWVGEIVKDEAEAAAARAMRDKIAAL
jgi:hypothetical protein